MIVRTYKKIIKKICTYIVNNADFEIKVNINQIKTTLIDRPNQN
jgi:hypothetical protein